MTCEEASPLVSALYDGEEIDSDALQHISNCPDCRKRMSAYELMGCEMRLLASCQTARTSVPEQLKARLAGPRFSVLPKLRWLIAGTVGAVLATVAVVPIVRAQSEQPKWFQFSFGTAPQPLASDARRAGFDEIYVFGGSSYAVGAHLAIVSIEDNSVKLSVHAKQYPQGSLNSSQVKLDLDRHDFTYVPGETLQIPVDGGGTLFLNGEIKDHQPKFAFGNPVEPEPNQLVLTCPILIQGDSVLANMDGGSTHIHAGEAATIGTAQGQGAFDFALEPFPGAVAARAEWGRLKFSIDGIEYELAGASPLTGGEQPRTIWVRRDASDPIKGWSIGARSISDLPSPK
jgi:hypothetical protein